MTTLEAQPVVALPDALAPVGSPSGRRGGSVSARLGLRVLRALISVAVVLLLWELFLKAFHVSSFVGKNPWDVYKYLFTDPGAGANRTAVIKDSGVTLRDALLGLAGGTVAAVAASLGFHLWRLANQALMPVAITLRSVPLVAMTPLIVGIFGRNLLVVTIIAGIVTFFPTLVNVTVALDSAPKEALDLCRAYGASPSTTLRKVQVPVALPALFASLRIAAPLSLVGALLAEFLATGHGLGYVMVTDGNQSIYSGMWSRVVVATLLAMVLYLIIGAAERVVLARFGDAAR